MLHIATELPETSIVDLDNRIVHPKWSDLTVIASVLELYFNVEDRGQHVDVRIGPPSQPSKLSCGPGNWLLRKFLIDRQQGKAFSVEGNEIAWFDGFSGSYYRNYMDIRLYPIGQTVRT